MLIAVAAAVVVVGPAAPVRAATLGAPVAPFPECPNYGYQVTLPEGAATSTLARYDIATATLVPIKDLGRVVNSVGYSETQNVFWGLSAAYRPAKLLRIDSQGNLDDIGPPIVGGTNVSEFSAVAGTVQGDRMYIQTTVPANHLYVIDVNPSSPTLGAVLSDFALTRGGVAVSSLDLGDWDFNTLDGLLYSVEKVGTSVRRVITVDPASGAVATVADVSGQLPDGANYGAVYVENGSGTIYTSNNDVNRAGTASQTFEIRLTSPPSVTGFAQGPPLRVNDGADCLLATDFGDAPDSFGSLDAGGGPGHILSTVANPLHRLVLGATVDSDIDGLPGPEADGDDQNLPVNDEDAVPAGTTVDTAAPALDVPLINTTGAAATLAGWLDLDGSGAFDAAERAVVAVPAGAASARLAWSASARLAEATTVFLRLRLYAGTVADPQPKEAGFARGGEVEDHRLTFGPAAPPGAPILTPVGGPGDAGGPGGPGDPGGLGAAAPPGSMPSTGVRMAAIAAAGMTLVVAGVLMLSLLRVVRRLSRP